jgi:hypothetical protein
MTTSNDTTDRSELLARIATERDAEVATLKDHIAKLEAAGRFAAAAPLKTKLAKLASR